MKQIKNILKDSIIKFCSTIGKDPLLVQGAGGNVSWKDEDILWIKASGTWLAEAAEKDIFVPVNLAHLRIEIANKVFSVTPRLYGDSVLRPSIETLLHALMPHRVVVHLHAIEILTHLVRNNFQPKLESLLTNFTSWAIVDYHKPGEGLAAAVSVALTQKPNINVIFLKNHGVVIGGEDVSEVNEIIDKLNMALNSDMIDIHPTSHEISGIDIETQPLYFPIDIPEIHNLALNSDLFNRLKKDWVLYPDHVVFLGPAPTCYDTLEFLIEDIKKGNSPEFFFLKGKGVFSNSNFSIAKKTQLLCYYHVLSRQSKDTILNVLNEQQIAELLNWDADHYRQLMAKHNIS